MKKNNKKKGFTIVELVIVIAVIAILAAVLIPTFSNVISKAKNSADLQEARNAYTEYLNHVNAQPLTPVYVEGGDQYFKVENGKMSITPTDLPTAEGAKYVTVSFAGNTVTITCTAVASHQEDTTCSTCKGQHNYEAPEAGG